MKLKILITVLFCALLSCKDDDNGNSQTSEPELIRLGN